jgi:diguanylate cyclase (GGDEF)-like protein
VCHSIQAIPGRRAPEIEHRAWRLNADDCHQRLRGHMVLNTNRYGFNPREHRVSVFPSTIAGMAVLAATVFNGSVIWPQVTPKTIALIVFGVMGICYLAAFDLWVIPSPNYRAAYSWINSVATALGLSVITYCIPTTLDLYVGVLLILAAITSSIIADRGPTYVLIVLTTLGSLAIRRPAIQSLDQWLFPLSILLIAIIIVETVAQLTNLSRSHIRRLQSIAEFSRNITSTLDTRQVMALLNAAFQNAVEADTYFVGIQEGDELRLELVYDDGEYFDNQRVQLDGSLSSWVLDNQRSLFLPDLRKEVDLPGVRLVLVGKHKTSLSWMGVPMKSDSVDGIISIGSYRPNAFDRADLELLSTLAQHAGQALDNTHRHEQVELRAKMDSLTGVFNHGNFLKLLQQHADQASAEGQLLSLIMLDVDHFKQYNDSYGHLVGDEVLTTLCWTMKQHVKNTDVVGRWGGEEFVISLPNASAAQAQQVALRIRDTMLTVTVRGQDQAAIPVPTVSQGIAVFPQEASNLVELIHLADRRLYIAKARGRNQIEPDRGEWESPIETAGE